MFRLSPLGLPDAGGDVAAVVRSDAGRLFVERAASRDPAFALTPITAPAVVRICRELDGLPLAVVSAAARVDAVSVGVSLMACRGRGGCAVPPRVRRCPGTVRLRRRLTGVMACSGRWSRRCCGGCRCSLAGGRRRRRVRSSCLRQARASCMGCCRVWSRAGHRPGGGGRTGAVDAAANDLRVRGGAFGFRSRPRRSGGTTHAVVRCLRGRSRRAFTRAGRTPATRAGERERRSCPGSRQRTRSRVRAQDRGFADAALDADRTFRGGAECERGRARGCRQGGGPSHPGGGALRRRGLWGC